MSARMASESLTRPYPFEGVRVLGFRLTRLGFYFRVLGFRVFNGFGVLELGFLTRLKGSIRVSTRAL